MATLVKKVCVVTSNRADFGLLYWLMKEVQADEVLDLQIIATGGHFSSQQGYTWKSILESGFQIDEKVECGRTDDSGAGAGVEMGGILAGMAKSLQKLSPDLLVILGDRFEMLSAASAAMLQNIPIAHLHGGELTEGAFDDMIRHAITKLSKFHFVAASEYRSRVIQLGEQPSNVFNVGYVGLDWLHRIDYVSEQEIRIYLGIPENKPYVMLTWHPETLSITETNENLETVLAVLQDVDPVFVVISRPNNDPQGNAINSVLEKFCQNSTDKACIVDSLGIVRYLSAIKYSSAVVGNSSSGLTEAPALAIPTINIGDRQKGRLRANSVVDCEAEYGQVKNAVCKVLSDKFNGDDNINTPYGMGEASIQVVQKIHQLFDENKVVAKKEFYDIKRK